MSSTCRMGGRSVTQNMVIQWEQAGNYTVTYVWVQVLLSITGWSLIISALWVGARFLHSNNAIIRYADEAVLPFYILHQPVLVVIAFYLLPLNLNPGLAFVIVSTLALLTTLAFYELLIRRFKLLRRLFGMKMALPSRVFQAREIEEGPSATPSIDASRPTSGIV